MTRNSRAHARARTPIVRWAGPNRRSRSLGPRTLRVHENEKMPMGAANALARVRARTASGDDGAWPDLFVFVEQTASPAVRHLLRRFGFDPGETEEVVLEVIEELFFDDCRRLRSCRAESEEQFRAWLRATATRSAIKWIRRRVSARAGRKSARAEDAAVDRSGPDEFEVRARLEEWRPLMAGQDFRRLLLLTGLVAGERPISPRTRRRWTRRLVTRYPPLFNPTK